MLIEFFQAVGAEASNKVIDDRSHDMALNVHTETHDLFSLIAWAK